MELRTLAEANHPSIVRFYQSFLNDGAVVIVMEHMDAGSMADVLQKHRSISEPYLAQIALQVTPVMLILVLLILDWASQAHCNLQSLKGRA